MVHKYVDTTTWQKSSQMLSDANKHVRESSLSFHRGHSRSPKNSSEKKQKIIGLGGHHDSDCAYDLQDSPAKH